MTRERLIADVANLIDAAVKRLESAGIPGSVHCEIHMDSTGPKKVLVTTQEAHPVRS